MCKRAWGGWREGAGAREDMIVRGCACENAIACALSGMNVSGKFGSGEMRI